MELQITQTRHPKSVADRRTDREPTNEQTDGRSGPTTRPAFAKATQVKKRQKCTIVESEMGVWVMKLPLNNFGWYKSLKSF